jgi:hypothetical protein
MTISITLYSHCSLTHSLTRSLAHSLTLHSPQASVLDPSPSMSDRDTQKTLDESVSNIRAQGLSFNKDGMDVSTA